MNRMRQLTASCGFVMRLTTTFLPLMLSPAMVALKVEPKGSSPSTQMLKKSLAAVTLAGHSTNLPKLYRYAALTSYSVGLDCWACKHTAPTSTHPTATTMNFHKG